MPLFVSAAAALRGEGRCRVLSPSRCARKGSLVEDPRVRTITSKLCQNYFVSPRYEAARSDSAIENSGNIEGDQSGKPPPSMTNHLTTGPWSAHCFSGLR